MTKNIRPDHLEDKYYGRRNLFIEWSVYENNGITEFYVSGKFAFNIQGVFNDEKIIEFLNLHEFIYDRGFNDGASSMQTKFRALLGLEHEEEAK